jgi:hypothetical protein
MGIRMIRFARPSAREQAAASIAASGRAIKMARSEAARLERAPGGGRTGSAAATEARLNALWFH